jgi:NADPH:quinone reductase-like Zn-dependent oxidoreductase
MKAIVQDRYGSADVLKLEDIEKPAVGKGQVILRVGAASVFIGDWHTMTGTPYAIRLASGLRAPKQHVLGQDLAGTVEAVGGGVTGFGAGDEVFGAGVGAFAEYATARPDKLALKPTNLSFEEAATVPTTGCTALQGLRNVGKVEAGQRVLVIGAAGGVGSFAVQIAKAFGAHLTAYAARPRSTSSARSAPTRSSTIPVRTSPRGRVATTSSSTRQATAMCRTSDGSSHPRGLWSSPAAKGAAGGSGWVAW